MIPSRKPTDGTTFARCRSFSRNTNPWPNAARCVPKKLLRKSFRRSVLIPIKDESPANTLTTYNPGDFAVKRNSPPERISSNEALWLSYPGKARRDRRIQAVSRRRVARYSQHDSKMQHPKLFHLSQGRFLVRIF